MPFLEGFGYGLATVILIGPVFFTLLKASLDHGVRGGVTVALGIIASDLLIVIFCLSGLAAALEVFVTGPWMALAAGVILVGLGLQYIFRPAVSMDVPIRSKGRNAMAHFSSGFLVNFVNPIVFAIWIGLSIHATAVHGDAARYFLLGVLMGIFSTDLAKAALAPRLRALLTPSTLKWVHLLIGIAMLLFSIRVFVHAARHWA